MPPRSMCLAMAHTDKQTHRQTDIADNTLTQPWGRVSKNYETELQSCFSHVKIVSLHILLSRFYPIVFTQLCTVNNKSEEKIQITVKLNLPLKGMSYQELDLGQNIFLRNTVFF